MHVSKRNVNILLILCIVIGGILHIAPYFYNRSLWVDEAMLASSICTRSFSELVVSPLDFGQSASVGWLFIVKLFTQVFGVSEFVLRLWSLLSAFGCIILFYLLSKDRVKKNYALLFTALFALADKYIYYANESKPYMSDNLGCLLVLYIWQKFKDKKIKLIYVGLLYALLVWFSFSAVFFVAACMIIECVDILKKICKEKDKKAAVDFLPCGIVLISFILNFIFWLSDTSGNAAAKGYWDLLRFPLWLTSLSDLKLIFLMAKEFLGFYSTKIVAVVILLLVLYYVAYVIRRKRDKLEILLPVVLSLVLLFIASYCGFYPIAGRLIQIYPLVFMIFAACSCELAENKFMEIKDIKLRVICESAAIGILVVCLGLMGMDGCKNLFARHVYVDMSEIDGSIRYLEENKTDSDIVYVYRKSIPVYIYRQDFEPSYSELMEMGSGVERSEMSWPALPIVRGDTIYGQALETFLYEEPYSYDYSLNTDAIIEDSLLIAQNESVYLFVSHSDIGVPELLSELEKYGEVQTVSEFYKTKLYHYIKK